MDDKLTTLKPDQQLALAVERGEVTKEQIAEIWGATEDLPATTPIETRKAVIAIRKAGAGHDPIEAMALAYPHFMRFVMDSIHRTEAALVSEESKWAHLVAGTESIVKSMQNVGVLEKRLEGIERGMMDLRDQIRSLTELMTADKEKVVIDAGLYRDETASSDKPIIDEEAEAELARKRTIGSAWAK